MALYATFDVNTPQAKQRSILQALAGEYYDKKRANPKLAPQIIIYGYMNAESNDDRGEQATERIHMENVVIAWTSRYLMERGVSPENLFSMIWPSPVKGHHHTIDIFFQVSAADSSPYRRLDMNTDPAHRQPQAKKPESARAKELSVSTEKEVEFEFEVYKLTGGIRSGLPEVTIKGSFSAALLKRGDPKSVQLSAEREWKPKLDNLLKSLGFEGSVIGRIEFALKLSVSGKLTRNEYQGISREIGAKIQAGLSFKIKGKVKLELSASESVVRSDGSGRVETVPVLLKLIVEF